MTTPQQTFIPGTEPQTNAELDEPLFAMLEAKAEAKRQNERAKEQHALFVARLEAAGMPFYPYQDPRTGKKSRAWLAKETKAKTSAVKEPRPPRVKRSRRRRDDDADTQTASDDVVTMRKVPRAVVEKEIDGFAATRATMETH